MPRPMPLDPPVMITTRLATRATGLSACRGLQEDGRAGLGHPEAKALLEVEAHGVGGVVEVADRHVLTDVEDEIAAPEADHDALLHPRRPDHRSAEDAAQVVEEQVTGLRR